MDATLTQRFEDALVYATQVHRSQRRKGARSAPYLCHLLAVAATVLEEGADENTAIAALLHDAAEDQGGRARLDEINQRFGSNVAGMVRDLSDSLSDDPAAKAPWRERKEAALVHLAAASAPVKLIKTADLLANMRSMLRDLREQGPAIWLQFKAKPAAMLEMHRRLIQTLADGGPVRLLREVEATSNELAAEIR